MIKIALKHLILERCIDVMFDGIFKNFMRNDNKYKIISIERTPKSGGTVTIHKIIFKYKKKLETVILHAAYTGERPILSKEANDRIDDCIRHAIYSEIEDIDKGLQKPIENIWYATI